MVGWLHNFVFFLQSLFKICFASVNIQRGTPEIHTEMYVCLHVKCTLLLSDFIKNLSMSTNFSKTAHYKIS
jgi:hypothetical protein